MYLEALRLVTQAAGLVEKRDYIGAIRLTQQAEDKFGRLAKSYPQWRPNLLQTRRQLSSRVGVGKQILHGGKTIGGSGGKALQERQFGVHQRQIGGELGHGGTAQWAIKKEGRSLASQPFQAKSASSPLDTCATSYD